MWLCAGLDMSCRKHCVQCTAVSEFIEHQVEREPVHMWFSNSVDIEKEENMLITHGQHIALMHKTPRPDFYAWVLRPMKIKHHTCE